MSEDTEFEDDNNMGDDYGRLPNEWFKQSQKDPEFNIKLARQEHKEKMRLKELDIEMTYYGGIV